MFTQPGWPGPMTVPPFGLTNPAPKLELPPSCAIQRPNDRATRRIRIKSRIDGPDLVEVAHRRQMSSLAAHVGESCREPFRDLLLQAHAPLLQHRDKRPFVGSK